MTAIPSRSDAATTGAARPARVRTGARTAAPRRGPTNIRSAQTRAAWILVIPFLVVFAAFFIVPLVYSAYLSLFTSQLVGGEVFSGLANYVRALQDPSFWGGLGRVALFLFVQVPIMLAASIFFALALDSGRIRGGKIVRLLIFVPYAVPSVVATLMWGYLYGNDFGLITQLFHALHLTAPSLLSAHNVLGSTMNIVCWEFIGYNMIVLYAALRSVPNEIYEAAEIDGAGQWRVAWSIKLPAIRQALLLTVIFSIIGSFQLFNEPNLLFNIAPNAIGTDFTPNLYAYNIAFRNQEINYAAAIAFLLGIIIMIVSFVVQTSINRKERLG
ncbi:sugar ABC transporter permease [Curtobacterium sp. MCBD17_034]|uniref:carbohydrate ABC transporter permease n=1 Tax=unclassified Curtobacterium TaxID=257496 RepID=UPI000DAACB3A|nr:MULTISPECIES: sugar ABC transporter permease [unclassified Curtobacterium]PZF60919.1 sugar ABC transporter permease [Curtobacterium sp. MCBD17_034]PZF66343.1 sugar ABC transporter permease [Curtobacterium sp. MCBD17_013]PZM40269.1 sugar ABC transporter permease [Curtobacterium sp. MCBD17_031]